MSGSEESGPLYVGEADFSQTDLQGSYPDLTYSNDQVFWPGEYLYARGEEAGDESSEKSLWFKKSDNIYPIYAGEQTEMEQEEEEETDATFLHQKSSTSRLKKKSLTPEQSKKPVDQSRKSLFVFSSPSNFPDINRARKSAFGSIFLRTAARVENDSVLMKTVADSSYNLLQSLLNSLEKVMTFSTSDLDRSQWTQTFRDSLQKNLEEKKISKSYSDGSVQWNIYPITQNYLFTLQVRNLKHQTRQLSRIEDRMLTGFLKTARPPHHWPSGSIWSGYWDTLGMSGAGTYTMPHDVIYTGKIQDGMFHDKNATLTYPNNFKAVHCVYDKGKLISCQFQFPDCLIHSSEDWKYCKFPDRRFWSEVQHGLKPAKIAQKTQIDPPRRIPPGCYDTGDGFYDPKTLMLVSPSGELLRVPLCEEDRWIKKYYRKGFLEPADFRPDLFENWFDYDEKLIQSIITQQSNFRQKKITYEELQQFYADCDLLPSWSKYKKRKSPSEMALEEHLNSIEKPRVLKPPKVETKYKGHYISGTLESDKDELHSLQSSKVLKSTKYSKSFLKFTETARRKTAGTSMTGMSGKSSKISFWLTHEEPKHVEEVYTEKLKRAIPEKFLRHQPILRPPFYTPEPSRVAFSRSKCPSKSSQSSSFSGESSIRATEEGQKRFMVNIIMEMIDDILLEERERHRRRYMWGHKVTKKESGNVKGAGDKCLALLQELFDSIPHKEEYCDSDPDRTCDLRKLAEDKYMMLKYWGKRMFLLEFDEEAKNDPWLN